MKRNIQSTRSTLLTSILAGVASASFTAAALAAGAGASVGAGAGTQVSTPGQAEVGGSADANMSTSGSANTNAQWRDSAVRGADRAAERMNGTGEAATEAELEATGKADAKIQRAPAR
jgi:hypothetical protein